MNPFRYGMIVTNADFCGRKEDIETLVGRIQNNQRTVIFGERRIGKTSLILEACNKLSTKSIKKHSKKRILFIDLMEVKSSEDILRRILKSLLTMEETPNFLKRIFDQLSSLHPKIGIDPLTGLPEVSFHLSKTISADSVAEIFKLIKIENDKGDLIAILDEFQDITNLKEAKSVLALIRSEIQRHSKIPYIFSGSIRKKLNLIFTDPDSPFFKTALPMEIGPIPEDEFTPFLIKKFRTHYRKMPANAAEKIFNRIYEITDHITGDVQQLCEALWSVTDDGETISESCIPQALQLIFSRELRSYEMILSEVTEFQMKVLSTIARTGGEAILSQNFLHELGKANASSVRKSAKRLVQLKILFEDKKTYRFVNPFFRSWLLTQ